MGHNLLEGSALLRASVQLVHLVSITSSKEIANVSFRIAVSYSLQYSVISKSINRSHIASLLDRRAALTLGLTSEHY